MKSNLLKLLHLADPTLPIGGFSHSAGLETYVQHNVVHDTSTAKEFVIQMLSKNIHYTDAALLSLVYDAATENNINKIFELDELCSAVKIPAETRSASLKMGRRLLKIFQPVSAMDALNLYVDATRPLNSLGNYCIIFGLIAALLKTGKQEALYGFYYNAAVGFVTNAVKLVPLSQQSGQEILFSIHDLVEQLVDENRQPNESLIGVCCSSFDLRCMQHETLYSRLYMS